MTGSDDWKVQIVADAGGNVLYTVTARVRRIESPEELRAAGYKMIDELVRQVKESTHAR